MEIGDASLAIDRHFDSAVMDKAALGHFAEQVGSTGDVTVDVDV